MAEVGKWLVEVNDREDKPIERGDWRLSYRSVAFNLEFTPAGLLGQRDGQEGYRARPKLIARKGDLAIDLELCNSSDDSYRLDLTTSNGRYSIDKWKGHKDTIQLQGELQIAALVKRIGRLTDKRLKAPDSVNEILAIMKLREFLYDFSGRRRRDLGHLSQDMLDCIYSF